MKRNRSILCFGLILFGALVLALHGTWANAVQAQAPTRTPLPSLTPSPTADLGLPTAAPLPTGTATATTNPLLQPSPTSPLLAATETPAVSLTPTPPLVQPGSAPPLDMPLPSGWVFGYQIVPVRVALEAYPMNVAIYRGRVTGGIGTILILWGFPSIAPPPTLPPLPGTPTTTPGAGLPGDFASQMLWTDGLRLLQGTVVDITCNVGTAGQQAFTVGGVSAVGTYFNVSQCQGEPDTAGWFAGVRQFDRNFLFYAYIEPIEAYNNARGELQRILDGVVFRAAEGSSTTPSASATPGR